MDNIIIDSSDSDSDYEDSSDGHSEREEYIYENTNFLNHISKKEYETHRNKLFTPDLEEIDILVESESTSNSSDYIFNLFSNSNTGSLSKYKNVIGIKLIYACVTETYNSHNHFVDICLENIPNKSTIKNKHSRNIIGRMCMHKGHNKLNEYEPNNIKDQYFFPITIDKLHIKLYFKDITNNDDWTLYPSGGHNTFIIRLTVLRNLNLLK